jgi:hypothetical protein
MRSTFFPGQDYPSIIASVRASVARTGVQIVGSLYHVGDGGWRREHEDGRAGLYDLDFNDRGFDFELAEKLRLDKAMGSEYITFQISLPPQHLNTGGLYRENRAYIERTAQRIASLQAACFKEGLNCYIETHVDRISEDVAAFAAIMDACPVYFEVNAVS